MSEEKKIIFKGEEYLFKGKSLEEGGVIIAKDEDDAFEAAYAYLHPNGIIINSSNEIIGTTKDILVIDDESEEIN